MGTPSSEPTFREQSESAEKSALGRSKLRPSMKLEFGFKDVKCELQRTGIVAESVLFCKGIYSSFLEEFAV